MECCRCHQLLDPELPPAFDFRGSGLVCPPCHREERAYVGSRDFGDVAMAQVNNAEEY